MNSVTPVGDSRCSPGLTNGTSSLCCVSAFKVSPDGWRKRCLTWLIIDVPNLLSAWCRQYVSKQVCECDL